MPFKYFDSSILYLRSIFIKMDFSVQDKYGNRNWSFFYMSSAEAIFLSMFNWHGKRLGPSIPKFNRSVYNTGLLCHILKMHDFVKYISLLSYLFLYGCVKCWNIEMSRGKCRVIYLHVVPCTCDGCYVQVNCILIFCKKKKFY